MWVPLRRCAAVQRTKRLKSRADEGHGAQKRENRVLMMGRAIGFFRKHLGAN